MQTNSHLVRAVGAVALAFALSACAAVPDAPVPPGYAELVAGARASLLQNIDGLIRPSLVFVQIRCFADGGHVAVFREVGGPDAGRTAFALQGPGAAVDGWGGGFGQDSMVEEVAFNFSGVPEIACPPRAG
jgi:hypothetical protein